jgi:hypothetical protein
VVCGIIGTDEYEPVLTQWLTADHSYHAGKYLFPNDEAEQDREELKHNLTVYLCDDRLFFAPIEQLLEQGAEVLDLGTGIGKWCIDREIHLEKLRTRSRA